MQSIEFTGGNAVGKFAPAVRGVAAVKINYKGVTYQAVAEPWLGNYNDLRWVWHCRDKQSTWRLTELPEEVIKFWEVCNEHERDIAAACVKLTSQIQAIKSLFQGNEVTLNVTELSWLSKEQRQALSKIC